MTTIKELKKEFKRNKPPYIYILECFKKNENGIYLYIGQSVNPISRTKQHYNYKPHHITPPSFVRRNEFYHVQLCFLKSISLMDDSETGLYLGSSIKYVEWLIKTDYNKDFIETFNNKILGGHLETNFFYVDIVNGEERIMPSGNRVNHSKEYKKELIYIERDEKAVKMISGLSDYYGINNDIDTIKFLIKKVFRKKYDKLSYEYRK